MNHKPPEAQRPPRPQIVTTVRAKPGAYRRRVDLTQPGSESAALPTVPGSGRVKVQVGLGLRAQELPQTVAAARQLRHVAVVEILGQTRRAVEDARTIFETAWDIFDAQDKPGGEGQAAEAWLALMVAMRLQEAAGGGASFWNGRTFTEPFTAGGGAQ